MHPRQMCYIPYLVILNAAELYRKHTPDPANRTIWNLNLPSYLCVDSARPMVEKMDTDRLEIDSTRTGLFPQLRSRKKMWEGT